MTKEAVRNTSHINTLDNITHQPVNSIATS